MLARIEEVRRIEMCEGENEHAFLPGIFCSFALKSQVLTQESPSIGSQKWFPQIWYTSGIIK